MKLARNMLTFTSYVAACEAMKLAEAAGLDLQALGRVVRHTDALTSGPGAIMVRDDMNDLEPDNFLYQPFLHTRGLGEKDLSLALALGESVSVDLPRSWLISGWRRDSGCRTQGKRRKWTSCVARASPR